MVVCRCAVAMLVQLDVFITTSFIIPTRESVSSPNPVDLIDYCVVAGILLTLWLGIIYWKVLQVQENCFKSDLMEFNVWEELMWMMQQQKLQKLELDHRNSKQHMGKLKPLKPPVAAAGEERKSKRSSLIGGGAPGGCLCGCVWAAPGRARGDTHCGGERRLYGWMDVGELLLVPLVKSRHAHVC